MDLIEAGRNRRIEQHLPLVRIIAGQVYSGVRIRDIQRDDLIGYGTIGLCQAAESYDHTSGVPFGAWARMRIHGAIIDGLRTWDRLGRGHRRAVTLGQEQAPEYVDVDMEPIAGDCEPLCEAGMCLSDEALDGMRVGGDQRAAVEVLVAEELVEHHAVIEAIGRIG